MSWGCWSCRSDSDDIGSFAVTAYASSGTLRPLFPARSKSRSTRLSQQLEGVGPFLAQKAGDAPEHAQRLDRPGGLRLPHVRRVPSKLIKHAAHEFLGAFVVSA